MNYSSDSDDEMKETLMGKTMRLRCAVITGLCRMIICTRGYFSGGVMLHLADIHPPSII